MKDTVPASDLQLQIALIDSCFESWNDIEESVRWTKYYNVPLDKIHPYIKDHIQKSPGSTSEENFDDEEEADKEKIHQLKLPTSRMKMIDTVKDFHKMIDELVQEEMIAFDTEWKPAILKNNEISLIQLATRKAVYLIDVMTLADKQIANEDWARLGREIFNNENILKLGFAQSTDFSMFDKHLPAIGVQYETMHSQLDIQELWRKLEKNKDFLFPHHDEAASQNQSLSNLVKLCLGAKLDKSNQFSNWANRPLRQEQMVYAALDAFCLFEIYDVIEKLVVEKLKRDFNAIINDILLENRKHFASLGKKKENNKKQHKKKDVKQAIVKRSPVT